MGAGCADDQGDSAKQGDPVELEFTTAESFAALMVDAAQLCSSGEMTLPFEATGTVYSLAFYLGAGETAQMDTNGSPLFDTVLRIYGPADASGYYGAAPVAQDDDGGDGALSSLAYTAVDPGAYVVVVSTFSGVAKGTATLQMSVDGAAGCALVQTCLTAAECDDADACTIDTCSFGQCSHAADSSCEPEPDCVLASDCPVPPECQLALCDEGICSTQPDPSEACNPIPPACTADADCTTELECKVAVCVDGACATEDDPACPPECAQDSDCETSQECMLAVCEQGVCGAKPDPSPDCQPVVAECAVDAECDDSDDCTTDTCSLNGECEHAAIDPCPEPVLAECPAGQVPVCILTELDGKFLAVPGPDPELDDPIATALCDLRIARREDVPEADQATAVQLALIFPTDQWEFVSATDHICVTEDLCFDLAVVQWPKTVAAQPLSTGHSISMSPSEPTPEAIEAQGKLALVLVNLTNPSQPLTDATINADGVVTGDPRVLTFHFRPIEASGAEFPVAICAGPAASDVAVAAGPSPVSVTHRPDGLLITGEVIK